MERNKLILISFDALSFEDIEYLKAKKNFAYVLENGSWVRRVHGIYPTLTYPSHATMITGCSVAKHGITNNTHMIPGNLNPIWVWYHDAFQVKDLLTAAKEQGLTTAAIGWPSMGRNPAVDYIIAEVAGPKNRTHEEFVRDYKDCGATDALWETVGEKYIYYRLRANHPSNAGWFNSYCALEIFRLYQPDVLVLHCASVDSAKHDYGAYAERSKESLDECEIILGEFLRTIRELGLEGKVNLVVTSDHGQSDVTCCCYPNVLLRQNGMLEVDENGRMTDWKAWTQSAGMCSEVFVKDPADEAAVYDLLRSFEGQYGIEKVFTREETAAMGFDGPFSFVIEGDGSVKLSNGYLGNVIEPYPHPVGCHGCLPEKGPDPTTIAYGPDFQAGVLLPEAELADGAPTWAKVLGLELPEAEGRVMEEILR